jgi:hypothetical protein
MLYMHFLTQLLIHICSKLLESVDHSHCLYFLSFHFQLYSHNSEFSPVLQGKFSIKVTSYSSGPILIFLTAVLETVDHTLLLHTLFIRFLRSIILCFCLSILFSLAPPQYVCLVLHLLYDLLT